MIYFVMIPIVLFYFVVIASLCATCLSAVVCRREKNKVIKKRKNEWGGVQATASNDKSNKKSFASRIYADLYPFLYGLIRYMSIIVGKIPSHRIRLLFLRKVFYMDISKGAVIYGGYEIRSPWNISIGRSVIGVGALLDGRNGINIGDDVCLAQSVSVYTEQHDINDSLFRTNNKGGQVVIKDHAWVSSKTTILPKCIVEEGCVIASGATLTKSTEPYGVYAGLPAKLVSYRQSPMEYTLGGKDYWHFY